MTRFRPLTVVPLAVLAVAAVPAAAATAATAGIYAITDLGSLGQGVSDGNGINATGGAAGTSYLSTLCRPHPARPCMATRRRRAWNTRGTRSHTATVR